jgi:hypothetical protein
LRGEFCEIGEGADGRVSRAEHRDGFAGIARAVFSQHIRHPVGNIVHRLLFAEGAEPVGAGRIWRMPGARCVDDGIGSHNFGALAVLISDFEGCGFPAFGLELVEADAADVGDPARCVDVGRENCLGRERFEVALEQFGAGRILPGFGRIPSG